MFRLNVEVLHVLTFLNFNLNFLIISEKDNFFDGNFAFVFHMIAILQENAILNFEFLSSMPRRNTGLILREITPLIIIIFD